MTNSKRVLYLDDTKDYATIYSFLKERYAWSVDATRYKEFLERVSSLEEGKSFEFQWSGSLKSRLGLSSSISDNVELRISSVKVKEGAYRPDSKHYYVLANLVLPLSAYGNAVEVDLGYIYFTSNIDTKDNTLTMGTVDYATSYEGFESNIISEVAFYGEGIRVDEAVLGFFVE